MKVSPESLARASSRHPWRTLGVWLVLIAAMGALSSALLGDVLTQDIAFTSKPESVRAQDALDAHFATGEEADSTEFLIVQSDAVTVDDPAFQDTVTALQGDLVALGDVLAGPPVSYYDVAAQSPENAAGLVSQDQRAALISVPLTTSDAASVEDLRTVADEGSGTASRSRSPGRGRSARTSPRSPRRTAQGRVHRPGHRLHRADRGVRGLVAALVPIVMALFAIGVALGLVAVVGQAFGSTSSSRTW